MDIAQKAKTPTSRGFALKPAAGFELATFRLQVGCTTTVLCWQVWRSLSNSNHNFLLYHNQFICLAIIAKKYLPLTK